MRTRLALLSLLFISFYVTVVAQQVDFVRLGYRKNKNNNLGFESVTENVKAIVAWIIALNLIWTWRTSECE
jgi:hypothetical protein